VKTTAAIYCDYLNASKTEREAVRRPFPVRRKRGFARMCAGKSFCRAIRYTACNRDKALMLAVIGRARSTKDVNIAAAHIDSPGWTSSRRRFMRTADSLF
jgi:aspartyl aminopeptidase